MDRKSLPAQSVKRKFYQWLMKTYQEDSFSEQVNAPTPDVTDIAGLLRSSGFRLSNVDIGRQSLAGDQSATGANNCKVTLKCGKSGLCVTLESDSACRCPPAACDDSASVWSVTSLSGSQESLTRGEAAGCSLLPRVPPAVAEVAGAATRCVMRLLDEAGGDPAHAPARTPRPPARCFSTGNLSTASAASGASVGSDGAAARRLSEQFARGLSSTSPESTRSLDAQQWCEVTFNLNEDFLRPAAIEPARIRRQSSTVEDYEEFEKELGKSVADSGTTTEGTFLKIETGEEIPSAKKLNSIFPLGESHTPKSDAAVVLSKAEGAIENMTVVLEYLKQLVGSNTRTKSGPRLTEAKKLMPKTVSAPVIGVKAEKKVISSAPSRTLRPPRLASVLAASRPSDPGPIGSKPRTIPAEKGIPSKPRSNPAEKRTPSGLPRATGARGTFHSAAAALRRSLGAARGRMAAGGNSAGRSTKAAQRPSM